MTTPHNHPANFGRHVEGCARCAELKAGAAPVQAPWFKRAKADTAARIAAIRAHDCRASGCGPVCTAFEW